MNTCTNCGTEFDGKFCPECGQKWTDDGICPQCGNKLKEGVKFCSECGCRIAQSSDDENTDDGIRAIYDDRPTLATRLYGILRYVPMALALLFAVLLPLLYIAPIAEAKEMLGAESINVYSLDEDFYGVSVAYLVFMCIAFLLSAILLYLHINKDKRQKYVMLFGKVFISVGELASLSAVVFVYLPCLIISAVAMGDAAELNEMLGGGMVDIVSAGAAPKAVLSLSVIFTVFAIGSAVASVLVAKANPELLPEIENDEQAEVTPCRKPLLYYAFLNAKLRRAVMIFFVCSFITAIVLTGCFWGFLGYSNTLISPHWVIVGGSTVTVVAVIWSMTWKEYDFSPKEFLEVVQKKDWNYECRLGIKKVILLAVVLMAMIITHIGTAIGTWSVHGRGYIMATAYVGVCAIVYVIAKIAIAKQSGYIAQYLFGVAGPLPNSPLKVKFDKEYELDLYDAYIAAKKHGIAIADGDVTKKKTLIRRLVLSAACIVFAVISVASAVVSPLLVDKFSASFVSDVVQTCREHSVYIDQLFGEPDEKKNLEKTDKYSKNKYIAMYYGDDYLKLHKKEKELQKQIEQATDMNKVLKLNSELETLKNRIANLTFNSLSITYGGYDDDLFIADDELIQVVLNTKTTVGKVSKKITDSVQLFEATYNSNGYTATGFYAEIFYTDGSYKYELVPTSAFSEIDFNKSGKQAVKWSDEWGSYSATVKYYE